MAAVLSEEPRLEKESTNDMPEDGDDEVEDLQEASENVSSKKKKKKKKKKKGKLSSSEQTQQCTIDQKFRNLYNNMFRNYVYIFTSF